MADGPAHKPLIAELRQHLRGAVLVQDDPGFELGRRVWNAAIDRYPAALVRCQDAEDVVRAVRLAADHGVGFTVRGGGHNVAGRSLRDGTLLLDLSGMRSVAINPGTCTALVEGGALWHDVDLASSGLGLATTGGMVSGTGVGGFTLGGGTGWLMRRHGLAVDNLLAASVVLADARVVRASIDDHPELFFGLRGSAAGLGVVTSFEFRLHPLRQVLAGLIVRRRSEARSALRTFRDFAAQAPDDFCGMLVLARAPSLPMLDAAWHGQPVILQLMCWSGEIAAGVRALEPLRSFGAPLAEDLEPIAYLKWQHMQDQFAPAGRYRYWKTLSCEYLSDSLIEVLCDALEDLPSAHSEVHIQHLGGAVGRVAAAETPFAARNAGFFVNLMGMTPWPQGYAPLRARVQELHGRMLPAALPAVLPNFGGEDDADVSTTLAPTQAERVAALRRRYDPPR